MSGEMSESVHGHEVMQMIVDSNKTWTRESLVVAIHQKFGTGARFHTCSRDGMSAAELIDFLEARGKFIEKEDGFVTDSSLICNH